MHLVPGEEPTSRSADPTRWLVNSIIDEIETLAVDCREAAADHQGEASKNSLEPVRFLSQAAEACDHIVQIIRQKYPVDVPQPSAYGSSLNSGRPA